MADNCVGPINIIPNNNQVTLQDNNKSITVIDNNCCTEVSVTQPITSVIQVLTGLPGRKGDTGASGSQGPSGSSAPFTYVSGITWSTTSSIEITGSLTISGSNTFKNIGPAQFTGSLDITGSGTLNGYDLLTSNNTGSLLLSSSFNSFTASYYVDSASFNTRILNNSSSIALLSSSFLAFSSSYNTSSFTGSFTGSLLGTSSYALQALSSSYTVSSSYAISSSYALSSSYSSTSSQALSSSYAITASYVANASSFPYTGSALITGSLEVIGLTTFTGTASALYGYWLDNGGTPEKSLFRNGYYSYGYGFGSLASNIGNFNIGIGRNALNATTIGNGSIAIGDGALSVNIIGEGHTAIGTSAFNGAYNNNNYLTGIGYGVVANVAGISSSIALGAGAAIYNSNEFVIGSVSYPINNIYIGRGSINGAGSAGLSSVSLNPTSPSSGTTNQSATSSILYINGAKGTGNEEGGDIIFQTAPSGSSGSSQNALVEAFRIRSNGNLSITRNLSVTESIIAPSFTGSLQGTSSYALTASFVANASSFPYTGSALITGSLGVTGSISITGSLLLNGNDLETQIVDLQSTMYLFNYYNFI